MSMQGQRMRFMLASMRRVSGPMSATSARSRSFMSLLDVG